VTEDTQLFLTLSERGRKYKYLW